MKAAVRDVMRKVPDDKKWMMIALEQAKQDKLKLAQELKLAKEVLGMTSLPFQF